MKSEKMKRGKKWTKCRKSNKMEKTEKTQGNPSLLSAIAGVSVSPLFSHFLWVGRPCFSLSTFLILGKACITFASWLGFDPPPSLFFPLRVIQIHLFSSTTFLIHHHVICSFFVTSSFSLMQFFHVLPCKSFSYCSSPNPLLIDLTSPALGIQATKESVEHAHDLRRYRRSPYVGLFRRFDPHARQHNYRLFIFCFCCGRFSFIFLVKTVRDQVYNACLRDILVRSGSCHPVRHLYMVGCCAPSCTHIKPFG